MKVRKSEMHKDGLSHQFQQHRVSIILKVIQPVLHLNVKYLTRHARHVTFVGPRLDPMDPDVFEKWPVRTETRETRY